MKRETWNKFVKTREQYRAAVEEIKRSLPELGGLQQELVKARSAGKSGSAAYTVETPIVYNTALDDVGSADDIRLILVADNPGRREQAAENRRYLVGPSGKLAETFFRENPSLGIDFRANAIILNKTPVHTARTAELRELCRLGGTPLTDTIERSQRTMARLLLEFHKALAPVPVWIIGYSEMKHGGIFAAYTEEIQSLYNTSKHKDDILLFRHFSMNQFKMDLGQRALEGESLAETLARIGAAYRQRIFGWQAG
ncbi:MAG: hypothetical protein LBD18_04115 [Treponema sp.]|jgi:hypothetical protein|nr:hypothetical protein [Treponema sp.]